MKLICVLNNKLGELSYSNIIGPHDLPFYLWQEFHKYDHQKEEILKHGILIKTDEKMFYLNKYGVNIACECLINDKVIENNKISEIEIWVDDVAISPGKIFLKETGSNSHNAIRCFVKNHEKLIKLGIKEIKRMRIGIKGEYDDLSEYVNKPLDKEILSIIKESYKKFLLKNI